MQIQKSMNLYELTIKEASGKLETGEITSLELTKSIFDRIRKVDSDVRAYITLCEEDAYEMAKASDDRRAKGNALSELDGIPVGIKDAFLTKGIKTTNASKILEDFIPPYDSTVVKKLKDAGCVIIGKLNTDEFTMGSSTENSAFLKTRNPWDLERVPGGSSGGSAAAVAADECIFALGTDTGGSIRQPASFCSTVGMKVSYGLISRYGVMSYASSFDTIGPLTKTVEDAAIVLNCIAGNDAKDSTTIQQEILDYTKFDRRDLTGKKIGIPAEFFGEGLNSEVAEIIETAKATLKGLGAELIPVSLPLTKYAIATYYILVKSEASSNLSRYDGIRYGHSILKEADKKAKNLDEVYLKSREEGFGPEVKRSIMMGAHTLSSGYFDAYYKKAAKVRTKIRDEYKKVFEEVDVLIAPVSPFPAFKVGEKVDDPLSMYLADIDTAPINVAGVPAMSLPAGFTSEGLPVGLQIIGPMFGEGKIFEVASAFEKATDFHKKRPNFSSKD